MGLTIFMCNKFFLLKANTLATAFIVPKKYVVSGRIVLLVKQLKAGEFIMVHLSAALLFVIMLVIMYVSGKNRKKLAGNALIVKRITDSINLGIVTTVWNREQNIIYANDCFYEMVGYTRDEFYKEYANSLTELVARSNGGHVIEELYGKLASGEKIVLEFCVKRRDGSRVWLRANGVLSLYSGGIKAVSYIFVDVTEVNEARQRIAVDEERYRMIADISDEYIFEYTHSTDTIAFAEKYIKDFDSSAVVKNFRAKLHTRSTIYKDDVRIIKKILEAAKKAKKKLTFEVRLVDKHNSVQWHRFVCKTIFDESGNPYKTIGKFVNIDSEKKEREVLKLQAQTDPLTKLYNRTQFEETVCRYLLNASPGTMYALLIIDIDGFKEANDKMGHLMGDRLLMEVAKTLKEAFGAKDIVSRLGGDEFIVFISDVSSHVEVEKRAEVLCRSLNKEYKNKSCTYNMSVSIGGVVTDGAVDFSGLYKDADQALYTAKNSGKNRHVIIKNFKREELT